MLIKEQQQGEGALVRVSQRKKNQGGPLGEGRTVQRPWGRERLGGELRIGAGYKGIQLAKGFSSYLERVVFTGCVTLQKLNFSFACKIGILMGLHRKEVKAYRKSLAQYLSPVGSVRPF